MSMVTFWKTLRSGRLVRSQIGPPVALGPGRIDLPQYDVDDRGGQGIAYA